MENNNLISNTDTSQISTEDLLKETECLLKELESRGYIVSIPKKVTTKSQKSVKQVTLNMDCKNIFEERTSQELITLLNGYSKSEINEFYNQISTRNDIKLSGSKDDFIQAVIGLKRARESGKAFAKW